MDSDANLTSEEFAMLDNCKSGADWDAACDKIKAARDGSYPPDWWPRMKLSGKMDEILARFGETSEIRSYSLDEVLKLRKS